MENHLNQIASYLLTQGWQIAILVIVIAAASWLLRNKSAHVRYLLWLIVLAKCLVPPLLTVPLPVLPDERVMILLPPSQPMGVEPVEVSVVEVPVPPAPSAPVITKHEPRLTILQWLAIGWFMGASGFVLVAVAKALRTELWLRRQRTALPAGLQSEIEELFSGLGVKISPKLWLVEGIGQPFVWGLLRGSIYLPGNFTRVDTPEHRRGILGHELSHILRFDAAVNLLQIAAQAVFWLHPFVWWANKRIRAEREKCCDEVAIARLGAKAKEYSSAIVNVLIGEHESTRPVPSLAVAGPAKNIEERIKTMLRPGKKFYRRPSLVAATIVLLLALLTVPAALVLTARAQTEAPMPETKSTHPLHEAAAAGDVDQVKLLISKGADVNEKDKDGRTPLHAAAWRARKEVAAVLLAHGANINEADGSGQTPLHLAANFGIRFVPEFLLAQGARIDARDKAGNTPLHAAADRTSVTRDLIELLIAKGADVKARNEASQTPLHRVSMIRGSRKRLEITAEVLLARGAEVDAKDQSGRTPLHFAVENGNKELVDLLVAKGADVKTKATDGTTLLHRAVKSRQLDMVERFLSRGIDLNAAQPNGRTALHLAASAGENSIVEALITRGADVKARDVSGDTPAQLAVGSNHKDTVRLLVDKGAEISTIQIAAYLGDLAAVKGFLERGGNVNAQDGDQLSALGAAAQGGQKDVAAFLISQGASVNAEQQSGMTALHYVALGGSKEVAELLIANGARLDAKAQGDITPLHMAAQSGAKDVALLLIDHGADVNAEAVQKLRPLDFAVFVGPRDMAKLLIDKGAGPSRQDDLLFKACSLRDKDLAEFLIRKGANVNSQAWGYAPAMEVIWSGYTNATKPADIPSVLGVLKVLLDHGADPDAKDRWDWSLLHYSCEELDLAKLLLDKGANPNAVENERGLRPLHLAADEGRTAAVKLLISRGADVNAKDYYGHTALSYAEDLGDNDMFGRPRKTPLTAEDKAAKKEVAQVLREHGAKD